jgi:murein L,D-transpeptidase YcbB/YkuD
MTHLVMNPYWNVPKSIVFEEILPKTLADPDYLNSNGFDLFSDWSKNASLLDPKTVDWSNQTLDDFVYKLRQRPGPTNALGRLKFMMPNDYNIYLHDTPVRAHFDENERSFSHGCVRVANPEALATAILEGQDGWSFDKISDKVRSGDRELVYLKKPLPVQLTYLTSWVDRDNTVHFRNDVYDRDQVLADALTSNPRRRGTYTVEISADAPDLIEDLTVAQ